MCCCCCIYVSTLWNVALDTALRSVFSFIGCAFSPMFVWQTTSFHAYCFYAFILLNAMWINNMNSVYSTMERKIKHSCLIFSVSFSFYFYVFFFFVFFFLFILLFGFFLRWQTTKANAISLYCQGWLEYMVKSSGTNHGHWISLTARYKNNCLWKQWPWFYICTLNGSNFAFIDGVCVCVLCTLYTVHCNVIVSYKRFDFPLTLFVLFLLILPYPGGGDKDLQ